MAGLVPLPPSERPDEDFGARLLRLRLTKRISRERLAKTIDCTTISVWQWETRNRAPAALFVVRLAAAFGVTLDYLLTGHESQRLVAAEQRLESALLEIASLRAMRPRVPFRIGQAA